MTRPDRDLREAVVRAGSMSHQGYLCRRHVGPDDPPIGTADLLSAALRTDDPVARALAGLGLTRTTAVIAIRARNLGGEWRDDAAGEPAAGADLLDLLDGLAVRWTLFGRRRRRRLRFTPAALRALDAARREAASVNAREVRCGHLLAGLLADPASRAAEIVAAVVETGADRALAHRTASAALRGTTPPEPGGDGLDLDLRFTRAVLLGQARYTPVHSANRLHLALWARVDMSWADLPTYWAVMDGTEHARRFDRSGDVGTEYVLLGILATHEVAHRHPGLLPPDAARLYAGGAVLADHGVTHRLVKEALVAGAGPAPRRAGLGESDADALRAIGIDLDAILASAERAFGPGALAPAGRDGSHFAGGLEPGVSRAMAVRPDGTGPGTGDLLATLLRGPDTDAWRLLVAVGADPDGIRQRLPAAGG